MAAATIPIAVIAGNNAWSAYQAALAQGQRDVLILREVAAARHGAAVGALREMVSGLAADPGLLAQGGEACDAMLNRLRALKPDRYSNFWVLDGQGVLLCSGLPAPRGRSYAELDYVPAIQRTRAFTLGEFTIGVVTQRAVLPGIAPILAPDGSLQAMVGGSVFLDFLLRTPADADGVAQHSVWLLDNNGTILPIGNSSGSALPPPDRLAGLLRLPNATIEGPARDGTPQAWATKELVAGLHLLVGLPVADIQAAARGVLERRLIELSLFLLACLAAILIGVEAGVSRPLRRLAERVRSWAPGRPYSSPPSGTVPLEVRELDRALTAAAAALEDREQALTAALKQRDLLMAEIHHRVKNNLQIVASLLSLQADRVRTESARHEFAVARDRVQALATLHRHLYMNQSFQRMSLRPFLEELSRQLSEALSDGQARRVAIRIEADDIELGADESISLALLLTEAVSNSMRHAFPDGRRGTITISLRTEGDEAVLRVSDDGVGIGDGAESGDGLGTQLIRGFASHLGGEAEFATGDGTSVSVRFPLQAAPEALRGVA
ncbi:sensor histidine kinase [Roseomonas sp. CECT 9278]|uniref:sensor histidine kinase n=1 Tax=Roseomonas sp. CECT 9278 TaxID=2845823 RepID=UPI001E642E3E|nr:sensor histidine kinase [Roseomonas sp. CECT 9278]